MVDVRCDPIGPVNGFINWVFSGKRPRILRRLVSVLFHHVELPILQSPLRMPHSYGIIIISEATLGNNITVYQGVTVGSKREGRKAGSPIIENNVCIFPNAVVIGQVRLGAGAIIGPGTEVIMTCPGVTVVDNPARPIHARKRAQ